MYRVSARDIEVFAYHGVLPEEKRDGQPFLIDFDLDLNDDAFPDSDNIEEAVDYSTVVDSIVRIMTSGRYELIESAARGILDYLQAIDGMVYATVTVKKPKAPLGVEAGWIGVTLTS